MEYLNEHKYIHKDGSWTVANVVGTSGHIGTKAWSRTWTKVTGRKWPDQCQLKGCKNPASVGGHMYLQNRPIRYNFILPICSQHNSTRDYDYIGNGTRWLPVRSKAAVVAIDATAQTFHGRLPSHIAGAEDQEHDQLQNRLNEPVLVQLEPIPNVEVQDIDHAQDPLKMWMERQRQAVENEREQIEKQRTLIEKAAERIENARADIEKHYQLIAQERVIIEHHKGKIAQMISEFRNLHLSRK